MGAAGAVLLIAGCAAPETAGNAARPAAASSATTAAPTSAAPTSLAPTSPAADTTAPVAEEAPVQSPSVEPVTAETAQAPGPQPPVAAPAPAAEPTAAPVAEQPAPVTEQPAAQPAGYGCDAAVAYLQANAHPAFTIVCPGYAFGGQAVTCINHAPQCPNSAVIIINVPCPVAYMNEAANSWTLYNGSGAAIDPFGSSC